MDGLLMIAMNKHREICSIQSSGGIMLLKEQVHITRLMQGTWFLSLTRNCGSKTKFHNPTSKAINGTNIIFLEIFWRKVSDNLLQLEWFFFFNTLKVMRCSKIASVKVSEITELISKALENDKSVRLVITSQWCTCSHFQ